ncbi:GNAT family N-acetyltransferase [Paractinoplanes toevensis]|uniref:Acetyltransferase n=1 Tax=Paractinoplanes toevensis TaxID=571911 RepID=A0A919W1J1_9ACTN|nr:GNAT family N-acetyltransferase [Actinoplanes toevensis]GIM90484.1 acetyltransferase [Actinoplanes toevensis]
MEFRLAERADVPAILELLADDEISRARGFGTVPEEVDAATWAAFEAIDADPGNELIVGVDGGEVLATCQLTFTPGLSRGGSWRMTIEAVRVRADQRGGGFGHQLMAYAVQRARDRGCKVVQLTTDKRRTEAHRFYEKLGFTASHEGMKLSI